jgi:hypothetical protein
MIPRRATHVSQHPLGLSHRDEEQVRKVWKPHWPGAIPECHMSAAEEVHSKNRPGRHRKATDRQAETEKYNET